MTDSLLSSRFYYTGNSYLQEIDHVLDGPGRELSFSKQKFIWSSLLAKAQRGTARCDTVVRGPHYSNNQRHPNSRAFCMQQKKKPLAENIFGH